MPPTDYRLTFGLTAHSLQTAVDQSVIHFTTGNNDGVYGTRVPGVWLRKTTSGLQLLVDWNGASPLNFLTSPVLELDREYCFTLTCKDGKKGTTQFQIIMDGVTVAQGISPLNRLSLSSVEVYAGDPWYPPADATISDLYYAQF